MNKNFSITAAAKLFGRSRNTIRDHLRTGKLSYCSDGKNIDLSELLRLYGAIPNQDNESVQTVPTNHPDLSKTFEIEIAVLREKVSGLERLIEEKDKRLLLLTHNKTRKWFWQK